MIGCAGLVAAALAGLAVLAIRLSSETRPPLPAGAATVLERTRLAEQMRAAKEEAHRLHEERSRPARSGER
jgi:hypothetical protein